MDSNARSMKVPATVVKTTTDNSQPDLTSTLPEEVWNIIFSYLDSKDKHSCCITSRTSTFNSLLEPQKVIWLFDQVVPLVIPYLSPKSILDCRLVSKGWKSIVSNYIQKNVCHSTFELDANSVNNVLRGREIKLAGCFSRAFNMCRGEGSSKFLNQMRTHPGNPILTRRVGISHAHESCMPFLETFGKHIWALGLQLHGNTPEQFMRKLHQCLERLPNLRELFLVGKYVVEFDGIQDVNVERRMELQHSLEEYLKGNRCPILVNLKTIYLSLTGRSEFLQFIVSDLLAANSEGVSSLIFTEMETTPIQRRWGVFSRFPGNVGNFEEISSDFRSNDHLKTFRNTHLPLKRLKLELGYRGVNYKLVADILNQFQNTLECFRLAIGDHREDATLGRGKFANPNLELPWMENMKCLKVLELENCLHVAKNFIMGLGSLEFLIVRWGGTSALTAEEQQDHAQVILGATSDQSIGLKASFLWGFLGKLKRISCKGTGWKVECCSREMHEYYRRQQ